jgi:hypothetical protein
MDVTRFSSDPLSTAGLEDALKDIAAAAEDDAVLE